MCWKERAPFWHRTDSIYRYKGFDRSDSNFFFSALIQASIRSRMRRSVHSLRSCSSRSISSLIFAISPGESMAQVYAAPYECSILLRPGGELNATVEVM